MSLILDALRKSEAERRRGQSPDLFASPPVAGTPRPGPWPRALPALLLLALALLATFVLWPHRTDRVAALAEDALGPGRLANVDADANTVGGDLAPTGADTTLAAASAPASTLRAPVTQGLGPTAASSDQAPPRGPAAQASASVATQASAASSARAPASTIAGTWLPTPAAAIASPRAGTAPTPMAAVGAPSTPLSTPSTPTPEVDDNPGEALPPIAVLAASERAALPPLKLSMHVWNSEPRKRFAIIDGQRVTEGSTVGAGVIEEIRRDGVALNINGRRVLLPRP